MAYNLRKIDPIDLEGRKIVGVKLPFGGRKSDLNEREDVLGREESQNHSRSRTTIFVPTYQTRDAIKSNLLNYFMTSRGERYFNVAFGNTLLTRLFEMNTPELRTLILEQIRHDLETWFPRVQINTLEAYPVEDNSIQIYLKYSIQDAGVDDELVINLGQ